jgi:hypothetical protein
MVLWRLDAKYFHMFVSKLFPTLTMYAYLYCMPWTLYEPSMKSTRDEPLIASSTFFLASSIAKSMSLSPAQYNCTCYFCRSPEHRHLLIPIPMYLVRSGRPSASQLSQSDNPVQSTLHEVVHVHVFRHQNLIT